MSYIQGRWLGNTRIVQNWLSHLPAHYHQRAHHLFHKHGLSALLIGRFIAFVRTLLPTIAGLSGLSSTRFQFFNWMSGLLWVLILTTLGYALGKTPVFMKYEDQLMSCLMLLPVVLLVFGSVGSPVVLWKKKYGAGLTMVISRAAPLLYAIVALMMFSALILLWSALQHQESTLAIRPVSRNQRAGWFSIWHHLDANGIRFKSITPQDDVLLIKFDSSAQAPRRKPCWTARCRRVTSLRNRMMTATSPRMSRLRDTSHRFG